MSDLGTLKRRRRYLDALDRTLHRIGPVDPNPCPRCGAQVVANNCVIDSCMEAQADERDDQLTRRRAPIETCPFCLEFCQGRCELDYFGNDAWGWCEDDDRRDRSFEGWDA